MISSASTILANMGPFLYSNSRSSGCTPIYRDIRAADRGELDAFEGEIKCLSQRLDQGGLAHPRHVFQEDMLPQRIPSGSVDIKPLAPDDLFDILHDSVDDITIHQKCPRIRMHYYTKRKIVIVLSCWLFAGCVSYRVFRTDGHKCRGLVIIPWLVNKIVKPAASADYRHAHLGGSGYGTI